MHIPFITGRKSRKQTRSAPARPFLPYDRLELEDHTLRLQYRAVSSHGDTQKIAQRIQSRLLVT